MLPGDTAAPRGGLDGILAAAGLAAPRTLTLAVTGRCDLSCAHCLVEAGPRLGPPHVPAETLLRIVAEAAALGVRELRLTGGEPLLHPRWEDLVRRCCRAPGLETVVLQTNAAALADADARALRRAGGGRLALQVSLDGASPATHDAVRGPGAFARTLRGLESLRAHGLAAATSLAFTEMRHNIADLPALLELVERLGLRGLVAGTLVAAGRAAGPGTAPPTPDQYRALLDRYERDARFRARCDGHATLPALAWWKGRDGEGGDCCALGGELYLGADGLLRPCPLYRGQGGAVAGAHERPLAEVLARAIRRWALLAAARRRRPALAACAPCPARRHCRGGCLGRAQAAYGTLDAVEDRCELRQAVFLWRGEPPRAAPSTPATR